MPDARFQFELVSPERLIYSDAVAMVTVPGGEGEYSVLPGHAPLITTVKTGVIDIYSDENGPISERIFVAEGFAEITETGCTVLVTDAVFVSNLDRIKLEEQARALVEKVSTATDSERLLLIAEQNVLAAKIHATA